MPMGYEYHLSCTAQALEQMEGFLLRRGWERAQQDSSQFEHRGGRTEPNTWPIATLALEKAGLYFCDHGNARGLSAVLFRDIVDEALAHSDGVEVTNP